MLEVAHRHSPSKMLDSSAPAEGQAYCQQTFCGNTGSMKNAAYWGFSVSVGLAMLAGVGCSNSQRGARPRSLAPSSMPRLGTVDERFQSYNVEMLEVTGGRFWKPYREISATQKAQTTAQESGATPTGMDPSLYQYRPPIDLSHSRIRKLAAALGPAYVRVSGTWANTVYFHDSDRPTPKTPPKGFNGVLTRPQWKGLVDFAHAVNAQIVTSFATSAGTRDARGLWTPEQARHFIQYTQSIGGSIAAAEFMNEPTYAAMGGAPKGYDVAAYTRDIAVFRPFLKQAAPGVVFLGPGSVGEGGVLPMSLNGGMLPSEDLLKATGPVFDVFSYHLYAAVSERCASLGPATQTTAAAALSEEWLSRPDKIDAFYTGLRNRFVPGKPVWITETADAACGGNPWASTFLDIFRYLDQLGRLAKRGLQVHMHNTLASSDYGLLDEQTFAPRPNYWAALLWRKLMGTTVLEAGVAPNPNLHLYAHCFRGTPGGVALLVINMDRTTPHDLELPTSGERYTLTAENIEDTHLQLNGKELKLGAEDDLPTIAGQPTGSGSLTFAPASVTFLAIPQANSASCR